MPKIYLSPSTQEYILCNYFARKKSQLIGLGQTLYGGPDKGGSP